MALNIPPAPLASAQALRQGLQALPERNKQTFMTEASGGAPPEQTLPHQVFLMSAGDVLASGALDNSRPAAWRYILQQPADLKGGVARVTAEVTETQGGYRFANLQHGWITEATRNAVQYARSLPQVANGSFDLRMLRIPALLLDALWLKNRDQGEDLVVPIASRCPVVRPNTVYRPMEFLAAVKDLAAKVMSFDNQPR